MPSCVNCKKEFSSDFFHEKFTNAFITKRFKARREQILYEKEKFLLPATQPEVEKIIVKEKLQGELGEIKKQMEILKSKAKEIQLKIWEIDHQDEKKEEKRDFVCPCPSNECRGFLSTRYKCGICGIQACSECREIKKDDQHVCDQNTIETVKELQKTTRSCPNCQTRIFKIEGCDQMWCTQCNVAFCWRTGKIERGIIHNPHYFEYMRKNGGEIPRNPHEVQCGGMPGINVFYDVKGNFEEPVEYNARDKSKSISRYLIEIYRMVNHIREVVLRDMPTRVDNVSNLDLRIDFLRKTIDEDQFKSKLQRREKDRTKKLEQRDMLEMYCNVVQDLFTQLSAKLVRKEKDAVEEFIDAETGIRTYIYDSYKKFNNKYKSNISCPLPNW